MALRSEFKDRTSSEPSMNAKDRASDTGNQGSYARATIGDRAIGDISIGDCLESNKACREIDLKDVFDVDFLRSPKNELMVFEDGTYQGTKEIEYERFEGRTYYAYVWIGTFHRANSTDYIEPKKGLLAIKTTIFDRHARANGFLHPIDAFKGRCEILADEKGRIISIAQTNHVQRDSCNIDYSI